MLPFILAAVGGYLIGDSFGKEIDSKVPKFSTGGVPSGAGMFSFSEWELMPNNRYYRKFLISKEDAKSGKGRDITDLGVVESMEETDDGFYVVILSVTEVGKEYFEKNMGKFSGMMAKGGMGVKSRYEIVLKDSNGELINVGTTYAYNLMDATKQGTKVADVYKMSLEKVYPIDDLEDADKNRKQGTRMMKRMGMMAKGGMAKGLNTYKLRAEGLDDFLSFLKTGMYMRMKSFTIEPIGVPDVVVSFVTDASLSEIKSKLREVPDSHVMLETIKPINKYTGERFADGGNIDFKKYLVEGKVYFEDGEEGTQAASMGGSSRISKMVMAKTEVSAIEKVIMDFELYMGVIVNFDDLYAEEIMADGGMMAKGGKVRKTETYTYEIKNRDGVLEKATISGDYYNVDDIRDMIQDKAQKYLSKDATKNKTGVRYSLFRSNGDLKANGTIRKK